MSEHPIYGQRQQPVMTARQREVAKLAAEGLQNKEIAQRLVISERTVQTHLSHIYGKFSLTNRTELTAMILRATVQS